MFALKFSRHFENFSLGLERIRTTFEDFLALLLVCRLHVCSSCNVFLAKLCIEYLTIIPRALAITTSYPTSASAIRTTAALLVNKHAPYHSISSGIVICLFFPGQWERLVDCSYQERALRILEKWMSSADLHPMILRGMISKAYSDNFQHDAIAPVVKLNDQFYIQELFHGPTASFKDMALQLTPQFFNEAISQKSTSNGPVKRLILVATSGDTGSAVLEGFNDVPNTEVLILYPVKGVSQIQKAQMVSTDSPNTRVIGVNNDFDFCQTTIKTIFNDKSFNNKLADSYNVQLSAANSLNWGRLLPQVVYHASAYLDLVKSGVISMGEMADLCVPTGNFGNILAAYYAKVC